MGSLQKAFEEALAATPQTVLEQLLRPKLMHAGVKSWRKAASALAAHLINEQGSEFRWEDPSSPSDDTSFAINFTEEDTRKLEKVADLFETEALSEVVSKLLEDASRSVQSRYEQEWQRYRRAHDRLVQTFRNNLEDRWGKALDALRLLLDLCVDEGNKFKSRSIRSRRAKESERTLALLKLHVRTCQVASEIICLLENGFATARHSEMANAVRD